MSADTRAGSGLTWTQQAYRDRVAARAESFGRFAAAFADTLHEMGQASQSMVNSTRRAAR